MRLNTSEPVKSDTSLDPTGVNVGMHGEANLSEPKIPDVATYRLPVIPTAVTTSPAPAASAPSAAVYPPPFAPAAAAAAAAVAASAPAAPSPAAPHTPAVVITTTTQQRNSRSRTFFVLCCNSTKMVELAVSPTAIGGSVSAAAASGGAAGGAGVASDDPRSPAAHSSLPKATVDGRYKENMTLFPEGGKLPDYLESPLKHTDEKVSLSLGVSNREFELTIRYPDSCQGLFRDCFTTYFAKLAHNELKSSSDVGSYCMSGGKEGYGLCWQIGSTMARVMFWYETTPEHSLSLEKATGIIGSCINQLGLSMSSVKPPAEYKLSTIPDNQAIFVIGTSSDSGVKTTPLRAWNCVTAFIRTCALSIAHYGKGFDRRLITFASPGILDTPLDGALAAGAGVFSSSATTTFRR